MLDRLKRVAAFAATIVIGIAAGWILALVQAVQRKVTSQKRLPPSERR